MFADHIGYTNYHIDRTPAHIVNRLTSSRIDLLLACQVYQHDK